MNRSGAVASGAEDGDAGRAASAAREIAAALAVLVVYLVFTHAFSGDRAASDAHGRALLEFERWARLDAERPLNDLLVRHEWLGAVAAWEYATTYVIGTFGLLAYLWWTRNPAYAWARNTLILVTLIAICCFAVWPTTPPRLLPGEGYTDVIAIHHPPATWGTTVVSAGANPYAAMPSLHIGWVAWIGVAAVRARCGALLAWLCALHLVVTGLVIVATAAHYVVDIPGGLLLVPAAAGVERLRAGLAPGRRPPDAAPGAGPAREQRVAAADAFFLHVESAEVPQVVGGVAEFAGPGPSAERVRALMAERLPDLPRLTQRISPGGVLRRPRWADAGLVDLRAHVLEADLPSPGGRPALDGLVARLVTEPLDRDRPLWRFWVVRGGASGPDAVVILLHHAIADGIGVVDILRGILEPRLPEVGPVRGPGSLARAAAVLPGLVQLGLDGRAPTVSVTGTLAPDRAFGTATLPLGGVRDAARAAGARVTDVLLALTGEVVAEVLAERGERVDGRPLRAAVPMTLRAPAPPGRGRTAVPGNLTAALRLDVPVAPMPVRDRLAAVHEAAERRRRSGRAVASTAAMRLMGALPPPLHARAARGTYRGRFFGGIVSNMPGPPLPMSLAGAPLGDVHPILPLADGVPFAVGALSWNGALHVSVTAEPRVLPEAARFPEALLRAFERLAAEVGAGSGAQSGTA
ncbi:bifunctional phosphatase PAP2/O-acyltransferase family protein [Actinomadura madurae]|uniref:bifunctional phosphatase PAP2/O-acyltransferase family protein n=1 Tax=Actinomadura madurae TaxID=1993 RepID=UPI000D940E56|nr:phosphatase PAP2 family protein [Actinomadura madurae]SPT57654.1 Probable diacyglycerol O-acyltransferase tgs1 [Actinomadura madurae]